MRMLKRWPVGEGTLELAWSLRNWLIGLSVDYEMYALCLGPITLTYARWQDPP